MVEKKEKLKSPAKDKKAVKKFLKQFNDVTKDPHEYLSAQPKRANKIKDVLKNLYRWTLQKNDGSTRPDVLSELVLDGMDEEQIWQQVEIYNECICPGFIEETSKLLSVTDQKFDVNLEPEEDGEDEELEETLSDEFEGDLSEDDEDFDEDIEEDSDDGEANESMLRLKKKNHRKTVVDDKFFKLGEMEEFLNMEDAKEQQKSNKRNKEDLSAIDYFNDNLSDEDEENVNYKDFFQNLDGEEQAEGDNEANAVEDGSENDDEADNEGLQADDLPEKSEEQEKQDEQDEQDLSGEDEYNEAIGNGKIPAFEQYSESDDNSEADADKDKVKSSYEMRQDRLKQRITQLEEDALAEKSWQLKGEITATGRPQNSLLQEVLEFDATVRPAPVITEETTMRLEDIIRQRIKNKAWDDVEKKVKSIATPQEYRKKLILDQEKSKESLAQIYEKEYQSELDKLDPNREEKEEEPKKHKQIKTLLRALFIKLDALSNFHYSPKPVAPEAKIITNTPAINMEEVAPVGVSNAQLLAPEEVKKHEKGDILGKSERSRTDKNRDRRKKKNKQRAIYKAKEERDLEKQKLGIKLSSKEDKGKVMRSVMKNKNVKTMEKGNEVSLKSSKAFFTQLQDKTAIKRSKKDTSKTDSLSAKRLKL